jgi:hypothetical protein
MTMKSLMLAAIVALSLGVGVANAQSVNGSVYQPNVPAYPGETAHVIGGQTFYYGSGVGGGGGGGAAS